jgi:hypothetical protein
MPGDALRQVVKLDGREVEIWSGAARSMESIDSGDWE